MEEAKPVVQVPKPEETKEETLNIFEKQMATIDEENITIGSLLEAIVEEVSHQSTNPKESAQKVSEFDKLFEVFQNDLINDMARIVNFIGINNF